MKKYLALLLSLVISFSALSLTACNAGGGEGEQDDKCAVCVEIGTEIVYKERGGVMYIGYPCLKCGYVDTVMDSFEVDFTVTEEQTGNEVTRLQQANPNRDLVICLKKGYYEKIFIGDENRRIYLVGETGTRAKVVQLNGDANGTTIDNIIFNSNDGVGTCEIKFETAAGNAYWLDTVIKNCHFEGRTSINSAWKRGIVDNLTVENCTFKNIGRGWNEEIDNWSSDCAIFIGEVWGDNVFKNCVFDGVDYSAVRLGQYSLDGTFLFENCVFKDIRRSRCINLMATSTLAGDPNVWEVLIKVIVNNCVFDCNNTGIWMSDNSNPKVIEEVHVGVNYWRTIPTSITHAVNYDYRTQLLIED